MGELPQCPKCQSQYTYKDGDMFVCRLVEGDHNVDCRIDGIGAMKLKSEFVKKA